MPQPNTTSNSAAQKRFDETYITAQQIADIVGVTRISVYKAADKGRFPPPIVLSGGMMVLWERAEVSQSIMRWRDEMQIKRNPSN